MKNLSLLVAVVTMAVILVAALFATGVIQGLLFPEPVIRGETKDQAVSFIAEVVPTDKEVVFLLVPKSREEGDYLITYEIRKDHLVTDQAEDKIYRGLSRSRPFIRRLPKEPGTDYTLSVLIMDVNGTHLFQQILSYSTSVGTQTVMNR